MASALAAQPLDFRAVDALVAEEMKANGIPGVAIAVVQNDRIVYLKGYGEASAETHEEVTADTLFRIGSTTKMFTAAAVLTLVNEGKLDLTKPISTYVSGLDPALGKLTTHQLLSHTAGMGDRGSGTGSHDDDALGKTIRELKSDIVELPPGDIYSYSSLGYWTAGLVLESISGKPFNDAVSERVFGPVGMKGSTFRPLMAMTYPHAQQHAAEPGKPPSVIRPFADQAASWPGGSAFASASGLARFMLAFLNDGVIDGKRALPSSVISSMSEGQSPLPGDEANYTYGLVSGVDRGVRTLSHGGARIGFGSMLILVPKQKVGVAVMANRSNAMMQSVARQGLEVLVKFTSSPPAVQVNERSSAEELAMLAGTYAGGPLRVAVVLRDSSLEVTYEGRSYTVKQLRRNEFLAEGPIGYFVIIPGSNGVPKYLHTNLRSLRRVD